MSVTEVSALPDGSAPTSDSRGRSNGRPPSEPTVVIGPRKKLPLDAFVPKPDPQRKQPPAAATKRRTATIPPLRSGGKRLSSPTQKPRSMPVAALPTDSPQVIAARSILALPSIVAPQAGALPVASAPAVVTPRVVVVPAVVTPPPASAPPAPASPAPAPPAVAKSPVVAARPAVSARTVTAPPVVAAPPAVSTRTAAAPPVENPPPIDLGGGTERGHPPPPPLKIHTEATRHTANEPTDVVPPLAFPPLVVASTRRKADATELVVPLAPPRAVSVPSVIVEPGLTATAGRAPTDRRRWFVAGAMGGVALVAVILFVAIGFSSAGVPRKYPTVDHAAPAAMPPEVTVMPPLPLPRPERAARAELPHEPTPTPAAVVAHAPAPPADVATRAPAPPTDVVTPTPAPPTDVVTPTPAPPSPAEVQVLPNPVPAPANESPRPSRRIKLAPTSSSTARKPAQTAKSAAKPTSRSTARPRPPTYDPDALFLSKP